MNKSRGSHDGATFARTFSLGSRALKLIPPLNQLLVGNNHVPKGWRYVPDISAGAILGWTTFDGDPEATKLPIPRLYKKVGVMAIQSSELSDLKQPYMFYAMALRFGQAVVVGALEPGTMLDEQHEPGYALIGTRIGHDAVTAVPGIVVPRSGEFIPATGSQFYSRIDAADVPLTIPVA